MVRSRSSRTRSPANPRFVISPTQQTALGKPIDEAAKKVKIIGIDSAADSNSFTSFLQTDNEKGGRVAADAWLPPSKQNTVRQRARWP